MYFKGVRHACSRVCANFAFSSSWQEVLADFEEIARLTVEEKNTVFSVLDFFEQEKGRKSLITIGAGWRREALTGTGPCRPSVLNPR